MGELTAEEIERSVVYKRLGPEGRRRLQEGAEQVSFRGGDTIFAEGNDADAMFLLLSGTVRVVTATPEGPFELAKLHAGAFFGEVGVLKRQPRMASCYAADDVEALRFAGPLVREVLAANPKAQKVLEAVVAGRAQDTIDKLSDSMEVSIDSSTVLPTLPDPDPNDP